MKLERLFQDIRYASRIFGRTPGFTIIAVRSLALGIGGNAAMFSLVNALLIRPLPYAGPDRLVRITGIYPRSAVLFFQQRSQSMAVAAVSTESEFNLTGKGEAIRIFGSAASTNLSSVLGTPVVRGRAFAPGEEAPGRDAVVILSYSLWKTKFGGDPDVIGRVLAFNSVNREIIGFMLPGFSYPSSKAQLWIPMRMDPSNFPEYWGGGFVPLVARPQPGYTLQRARGEIQSLAGQFLKTFPLSDAAPLPSRFDCDFAVNRF